MKYRVIADEQNFVIGIVADEKGIEIEKDIANSEYLEAYRLAEGKLILDEDRKAELVSRDQTQARAEELTRLLEDSDIEVTAILDDLTSLNNPVTFVTDLISLLSSFNSKYSQLVKDRKAWRSELNDLKK